MRGTRCALVLISTLFGCGKEAADQDRRADRESNYLAVASESEVLVFPLHAESAQLPERFRRIEGMGDRRDLTLIEAVPSCSPVLTWIDTTVDHWQAIIIPSENSKIWLEDGFRPRNSQLIECIQSNTSESFFVATAPRGVDTFKLTYVDDPNRVSPDLSKEGR